ncbi:hypothetical protein LINPERHAP1_LOCUS17829 [Linum perenne]
MQFQPACFLSFIIFLLFVPNLYVVARNKIHIISDQKLITDSSSSSQMSQTTGSYGASRGPNWDFSWGWGSTPSTGWGYGSGSSRSPNGFARGSGFGYGSGSGSGSGSGYGYSYGSGGGAHAGGYGAGSGGTPPHG